MEIDYQGLALHSLLEVDPNKKLHYEKMKHHLDNPENLGSAPVNPMYFQPIDPQHVVIITQSVYDILQIIEEYNFKNKKEVPFIMYGEVTPGGAILFNDIDCDFKKLKDDLAHFDRIEEYLYLKLNRVANDNEKNKAFCAGHTHPFNGNKVVFNYSLADLNLHLYLASYNIFRNTASNNKILSLMKSITKDYNFIYYDYESGLFQKITKVYLQKKKKDFVLLSSYQYMED